MSIFSRLKKPSSVEPKPTAEAPTKDAAPVAPPAAVEAKDDKARDDKARDDKPRDDKPRDDKPRRAAEPAPAAKPNGVAAQAAKPATPVAAPAAPKANGVAEAKPAPAPAAPAAPAKQPELAKTMLYGGSASATRPRPTAVPAPSPAPTAAPAPVVAPVLANESTKIAFDVAIEMALSGQSPAHGTSTASDQAALRATFEDLAVPYVADIRSVMMELRWGEVQASWLELARPVLKSLRKMAEPVGNTALVEALDRFDAALAQALAPGQPATPSAATRDALLAAYEPLRACVPRAFELDGERDRREPLIVRALLEQVPGLEPLMIDKMMAAGFGKLSALYAARTDELAAVTGIPDVIAAATAARVQAFRRATPAGLASVDRGATLRELARLLDILRVQNGAFEEVARGWSEGDRKAKTSRRRERQVSLLQITIELARLGEVDFVLRLEKLPFAKKIDEIDRVVGQATLAAATKSRSEARAAAAS